MSTATFKLQALTEGDVKYTDSKAALFEAFNRSVADGDQAMTVLRDEGLYRHLRFWKSESSFYHFDLITWPGYLTITGDIGCYTFRRIQDMFDFFTGYLNSDYWSEKLASGGRPSVKVYDEDEFTKWLVQDFWEYSRELSPKQTKEWWQTLKEYVLDDFTYLGSHHHAISALDGIRNDPGVPSEHYSEAYEHSWAKYDWHFEMCLAAIVTGIRTYKHSKTAVTMPYPKPVSAKVGASHE